MRKLLLSGNISLPELTFSIPSPCFEGKVNEELEKSVYGGDE